jgi:hypothetical protein
MFSLLLLYMLFFTLALALFSCQCILPKIHLRLCSTFVHWNAMLPALISTDKGPEFSHVFILCQSSYFKRALSSFQMNGNKYNLCRCVFNKQLTFMTLDMVYILLNCIHDYIHIWTSLHVYWLNWHFRIVTLPSLDYQTNCLESLRQLSSGMQHLREKVETATSKRFDRRRISMATSDNRQKKNDGTVFEAVPSVM